jgi:hypothetical protein
MSLSAPERLAREMPAGTVRQVLRRIESLRQRGRRGEVLRLWLDRRGRLHAETVADHESRESHIRGLCSGVSS